MSRETFSTAVTEWSRGHAFLRGGPQWRGGGYRQSVETETRANRCGQPVSPRERSPSVCAALHSTGRHVNGDGGSAQAEMRSQLQ